MNFPAYVPAAVRTFITTQVIGFDDDGEPQGWAEGLASAEKQLAKIELAIETQTRRGELEDLDSLRQQKADAIKRRKSLVGYAECLHRLGHDTRMRNAFALLTSEFSDDSQWHYFIGAALSARMDYGRFRERLRRAVELRNKIADTSKELARLLRDISGINLSCLPLEFSSIRELLRKTDSHEFQEHDVQRWQRMRPYVLGGSAKGPEQEYPRNTPRSSVVLRYPEGEKPNIDPAEQIRANICGGWNIAPSLSELLDTVAKSAQDFRPSEDGVIGAAIESRQKSTKTEYLRAFGHLLTDVHGFTLTTAVMQAMAIVANVVINLPDVDVSYDDVRKAVPKLGGEPLENSKGK